MRQILLCSALGAILLASACGGLTRRSGAVPSRELERLDTVVEKRHAAEASRTADARPADDAEARKSAPAESDTPPEVAAVPEEEPPPETPETTERVAAAVDTGNTDVSNVEAPVAAAEGAIDSVAVDSVPAVEPEMESAPDAEAAAAYKYSYHSGYRVQLMATVEPDRAREFAETVRPLFDTEVYVEYLEPYYKVRIGDCSTKAEAVLLLNKARTLGFSESWVTATQIIERSEEPR